MIEQKRFSGLLNTDDRDEMILPHQHKNARNVRFFGSGERGYSLQNVKGTTQIPLGLPSGTNECVGAFFDSVRQRILFFNYNSNGEHGLYSLNTESNTASKVFVCGTHSTTDILRLNPDYPVTSAGIIYRSETEGDLFYWTDGNSVNNNQPRYLNLDTVEDISPFTEDMINANKNWPSQPPTAEYFDDSSVTINNLNKKLFQFAYRWRYKNNEKSTSSPYSSVPIPRLPYEPSTQNDPTKNSKIQVTVTAGNSDYQAIEIWGRTLDAGEGQFGDFFLIDVLDRDEYNISPNTTFTYSFYNDRAYSTIPAEEVDLYFSWLPNVANSLEILNGNILIYAGITDGYDKIERSEVDVQVTTTNVSNFSYGHKWRWKTRQRLGLIYFDDRGKTNGVVSFLSDSIDSTNFDVTTSDYSKSGVIILPPVIDASINHLPPSWATSYQWVRASLTPKFIQTVTCDYQTDGNYSYLCIENFDFAKKNISGLLPSYEFTPGDRVMILGQGFNGNYTPYNIQLDIEILGVVNDRTMNSPNPATKGRFLKIKTPSTLPTGGFVQKMYIDIYTPTINVDSEQQLFYEFGERYGFYTIDGVRYHRGGIQNQTASQAATFRFFEGDVYILPRWHYEYVNAPNTISIILLSTDFSDYFQSAVSSNGRVWPIDENSFEEYNPVLLRWGKSFQSGTQINELNIFRPNDRDEVDRGKGDIRRLKARDRILRVFQDRGVGQYGIYARFIQNNEGVPELVTTNEIITVNNIQYYQGVYGLCGYSTNLCSSPIADYFVDVVTGREVRLSRDGITDLGMLYKGQFYLPSLVTPYNKSLQRSNGFIAKVMKFWDSSESESHTLLQQAGTVPEHPSPGAIFVTFNSSLSQTQWQVTFFGNVLAGDIVKLVVTNGTVTETFTYTATGQAAPPAVRNSLISLVNASSNFSAAASSHGVWQGLTITANSGTIEVTPTITFATTGNVAANNYCFNEPRNGFTGFFDYIPEWALSANDNLYSWVSGVPYIHNSETRCRFYGTQYNAEVQVVFNQDINFVKTFQAVKEIASGVFECPLIYTSSYSYGTQRQESSLIPSDFVTLEGNPTASFLRDVYSVGGILNGDTLKGNYAVISFRKTNANDLVILNSVIIYFIGSPLNPI